MKLTPLDDNQVPVKTLELWHLAELVRPSNEIPEVAAQFTS